MTDKTTRVSESVVEEVVLTRFFALGYAAAAGEDIVPEGRHAEGESFGDVLLVRRLRDAIDRPNPTIPQKARDGAFRKVVRRDRPRLIASNRAFHGMLRDEIEVEYMGDGGM